MTADAPASVLRAGGDDGFLAALHARGLRPHDARALRLFGSDSPPGASQAFRAQRDALVVVAAPGGRLVDGDPPASATSSSRSAAPARGRPTRSSCRAPLAEPRLDFRVDLASALAYEVRAGEYIQVIDVQGRQCSDFLAFHRGKLERGIERGLDGVTTRTLMGNAYPTPGPAGQVLRRRHGPAGGGRARHRRAPRHVRARLHAQVLRGHRLLRARQLHGELQRPGRALRDRASARAGRRSTSSTTRASTPSIVLLLRRAVVAPRRLRAAAGDDRSRVRLVGVPGRHRPGERLGAAPTSTCASTPPRTASRWRSPTASPRRPSPC